MTLGNLDIWATYDNLKSFFNQAGCPFQEVEPIRNTSALFKQLKGAIRGIDCFVHAQTLFEMMGINDYCDMDKYDFDKPRVLHDLNLVIPSNLCNRFSLIVEAGTMEHIFDVRRVMENIITMLRIGGWVIHFSPSSGYIDHGFYSLSPCFFYDFYHANGFSDFQCRIVQRKPGPMNNLRRWPELQYKYGMNVANYINKSNNIVVFFAARKAHNYDAIQIPIQGKYEARVKVRATSQRFPKLLKPWLYPHINLVARMLHRFRILRLR